MLDLKRESTLAEIEGSTKANNVVRVTGYLVTEFEFSHEVASKRFYRSWISTERLSGTEDFVPIVVSERRIGLQTLKTSLNGKWIEVVGQLRSYNRWGEDGRRHLDLFLFASDIYICEHEEVSNVLNKTMNTNTIYLDGYICKPTVFRSTPKGSKITDFTIAVNRAYGKSDYIPCIAWDREARFINITKDVGDRIRVWGRIQSRKYFKKYSPDSCEGEWQTTYEVSVWKVW